MRAGMAALAMAVALVAGACSSSDSDSASGSTTTQAKKATSTTETTAPVVVKETPKLTPTDCWWPIPTETSDGKPLTGVTITCGTVEVPADRTDAKTKMITIPVARIHKTGAPADAVPTVYLHGGPGGDALVTAPTGLMGLDSLAERDVITYDQRGSGRSTPSLNCPEKEEATLDALSAQKPWSEELATNRKAVQACWDRLSGQGIDLSDYNTPNSVADMETIRAAYGVDTWNVWGASYGTRLGLAYAREHPEQVRSLLIDSVYSPDVGGVERSQSLPVGAIDRLVEACDAQASCKAAYGDLQEKLDKAIAAFDAKPESVTGTVEVDGKEQTRTLQLTGPDVLAGMFAALYDSTIIPSLPGVISGLAAGDRSIIPAFVSTGVPRLLDLSEGAFYSTECADSGRLLDEKKAAAALKDPGDLSLVALGTAETFCQDWPVTHVPASFNEPVTVDVPTLVYGGTLDPITPYEESKAQADRMPDARFVSVPSSGHGAAKFDECTQAARDVFWNDPKAKLPMCTEAIEGNEFTVGG